MQWPTFTPTDSPIDQLVKLSRFYGSDPEIVIAGGGNTSVKIGDVLHVKGSGTSLANVTAEGFVQMDRPALEKLLSDTLSTDRTEREQQFKDRVMTARLHPGKGQRPSVEALLHHLMPRKFVVHSHATLVNAFTCCTNGQALITSTLGDDALWIGDTDPGHPLAQLIQTSMKDYAQRTGRDCPRAVIMKNHGLVICGETPQEVKEHTDWLLAKLQPLIGANNAPFGTVAMLPTDQAKNLIDTIAPALRGLLSPADSANLKAVTFDDSPTIASLVGGSEGQSIATTGPLSPDQIVYCKSFPLWFNPTSNDQAKVLAELKEALAAHIAKTGFAPHVVLVKGLGLFSVGDSIADAATVKLVYTDAVKVMAMARKLGGIEYFGEDKRKFIENWEVENYRRSVGKSASSAGRAAGKIAIVTGAAQGFGLEIAQNFVAQGGCAVLTDMNIAGAQKAADELCTKSGAFRAIGLAINVTEAASVAECIHQVIRTYGGFDVLISNAGVLKAGSVKTQPEKDFDFTTSVNYKGYFLCVQNASPVLALQHQAKPAYWSDIIQINSKSGLEGSNKNGAYAGSKFGGIGLTQSFALELVTDCIKVNSICPGNFFDGPLWSDPKTGLFVQYLNTGKVPGAKSIADVKRFYEAKVPMNRGCTTADVMKAVYYLMDQTYETGQAVPVTGGQVMLH